MNRQLRIGIIGDYHPAMHSHSATDEALRHAAAALDVSLESAWLATESLAGGDGTATLAQYDALWCAPGSLARAWMEPSRRSDSPANRAGRSSALEGAFSILWSSMPATSWASRMRRTRRPPRRGRPC